MIRRAALFRLVAVIACGGSLAGFPSRAAEPAPAESAQMTASAGPSISIAPLRVEIDSGTDGATVYLSNTSSSDVAIQSRLFAWSQVNGEDTYAVANDLTLSPSISMIPPGETQILRVLRKGGSSAGEKRFRLVVDQLPDPKSVEGGQAATRIRFSLPVFVDSDTAGGSRLAWRLSDDRLELANTGGATAKVVTVAMKTAGGQNVEIGRNTLRYVHGNSTITWPVGRGCSLGAVQIEAQIDGRTVDAQPLSTCG